MAKHAFYSGFPLLAEYPSIGYLSRGSSVLRRTRAA
jgi:hypothetical protein